MNTRAGNGPTELQIARKKLRKGFFLVGLLSGFINLLMLAIPLYVLSIYMRVLTAGNREPLILLSLVTLAALALLAVLFTIRSHVLSRMGGWLNARVSRGIFRASIAGTIKGVGSATGPLRDLARLQNFIKGPAQSAILDVMWLPVFLFVIWMMHPWLGALAVIATVILFCLSCLHELSVRVLHSSINRKQNQAMHFADDSFINSEAIHAMGMQDNLQRHWGALVTNVLDDQDAVSFRVALIQGLSRFVRLVLQAAIVGLGSWLVMEGEISPGHMIAAFILAGWAMLPVEQLMGAWTQLSQARGARARIQNLLLACPPGLEVTDLPEPTGKLEVNRLSFRSAKTEQQVLQDISFKLKSGDTLVVSGNSASGKSTLCRLLVGVLEPSSGSVRLDEEEVHTWERNNFGQYVGYLPQNPELFNGSIKQNIARMADAVNEVEVVMAAQRAGAHDMIMELPEDYDTVIGDLGLDLSQGQRQLVGLSRAMFGNSRLLVLDEPESNLDEATETAFLECLKALRNKGVTMVIVSHRQAIVQMADKVLILKEGRQESFAAPAKVQKVAAEARAEPKPKPAAPIPAAPSTALPQPEFRNPYKPRNT